MKYMYAKHPKIAKRWAKKYGVSKKLPKRVSITRGKKVNKKGK